MATATLKGKLTLSDSMFHAGLRRAERAGERFGKRLGASISRVANGPVRMLSLALGAAVSGATFGSAKVIADFGQEMSKVAALTGATSEQMEKLGTQARSMGATTRFTAGEAASGMAFLAQAGFKVNQILGSTEPLLKLAIAGGLGLAEAMDIASNIMTPFAMNADEASRVADVLAKTAASSNTNVTELGEAFKQAGPMAALLKIRFEEVAGAIGTVGNAGIKGEAAGTALRNIMARLVKPTAEVVQGLESIGLTAADVNPSTNSLSQIFEKLAEAQKKSGSAGRNAAANVAIFGLRAQAAGGVLISTVDTFRDLTKAADESSGAASRMAKIMADNLGDDFKALRSAIEETSLAMGEGGLTALLRNATQAATRFFRAFSADGATGLGAKLKTAGEAFLGMFADPGVALDLFGNLLKAHIANTVMLWRDGALKVATMWGVKLKESLEPFGGLGGLMTSVMQAAGKTLRGGMTGAVVVLYDALIAAASGFSAVIMKGIYEVMEAIGGLPVIGKKLGLDGFKAPTVGEQYEREKAGLKNTSLDKAMEVFRKGSEKDLAAPNELIGRIQRTIGKTVTEGALGIFTTDFGRAKYLARASENQKTLAEKGRAMMQGNSTATPSPIAPVGSDPWGRFRSFQTMGFGKGGLKTGGLDSKGGLSGGAYNTIRRGDRERREAEGKAKTAADETNELLGEAIGLMRQTLT